MQDFRATIRPSIYLALALWLSSSIAVAHGRVELPPSKALRNTRPEDPSPYRFLEGEPCRLEERLFADAADGRLDEHSLLAAALVASGVADDGLLRRYEERLAELTDQLRRLGKVTGPPRQKARAVFEFMHGRVLRGGYRLNSTDLTVALDQGRFNCVSASVLYICLTSRFGVTARGLEVPGHAMARLVLPDGTLDVETTCPRWFRLGNDPNKLAELVEKTTGFRHPSGNTPAERREVSGVELVATIYYNRGVDLLAEVRFAEAAAANAKALRLDPANEIAQGNLMATLNNWAISLSSAGRYAEAVQRLRQGLSLQPDYQTFAVNYVHVHHQRIEQLSEAGQFEEARDILADALQERSGEPYFHRARLDIYRRWARARLEAGQMDEAFTILDEARRLAVDSRQARRVEVIEVNNRALVLLGRRQFEEAMELLDRALAREPDAKLLADNRRAAVMRWAQPAFQRGDYAEAIRRTTHGAKPGRLHATLIGNVRYGYFRWVSTLRAVGRDNEADRISRRAKSDPFLCQ